MRIGNRLYFDHQASTPVDPRVLSRMLPYFGENFGNPHSSEHSFGWSAARAVAESAAQVASLLGADADEIIFTSGATEANNLALLGLAATAPGARRKILLGSADHKSALAVGTVLRERGFEVVHLRVDGGGHIDLDHLDDNISSAVFVVSICAVNSEIGTIQDLSKIHAIVHPCGALMHCDAAQAPCGMDVSKITAFADLMSLSAHKMYGPKGIGALYIKRTVQHFIQPIIYGGGQQSNLRSGTVPTPLCVGFGAAAELLCAPEAVSERERIGKQRDMFVRGLIELPWRIAVNGPSPFARHPGNANMRFDGFSAQDLLSILQPKLAASTGSACTSGMPEPSHVLRMIGLTNDQAAASVRFCIGRYTTDSDIGDALGLISGALDQMSRIDTRRAG
jgi:cysteine desulfurase